MAQSNVGVRLTVDAGQAKGQVEDLSRTVKDLNEQIAEAKEAGDFKSMALLLQAQESAVSARGQIMAQANQAQGPLAMQNRLTLLQDSPLNRMAGGQLGWMFQQMATQLVSGILSSFDTALSAAKMRAGGDFTGASVAYQKGMGGLAGGGIGAGIGMGAGVLATALSGGMLAPLIPILTQMGNQVGKFFGEEGAREKEIDLAYSAQYKNALPGIDTLNRLYGGDIGSRTGEKNDLYGLAMRSRAVDAARGTGLDTDEFIGALARVSSYGVHGETKAMNMATQQAMWSRYTGADLGAVQKYGGTAFRYGGEESALSTAYAGLKAQNMEKGQFGEFLTSMERIMEDGIAKGFSRSSKEIATDLQMLYELSGKSAFWQGEQGMQRLSQMNASIASAAALETPGHDIAYMAARDLLDEGGPENREAMFNKYAHNSGDENDPDNLVYTGTYIDTMQLLERGVSAELLGGIQKYVKGFEKGDIAGQIQWYKQILGLNDIGGAHMYKMMEKAESEPGSFTDEKWLKEVQEKIIDNPAYKSDSARLQDIYNSLGDKLANIGKFKFDDTEWGILKGEAENVGLILAELRGEKKPDPMPGISEQTMREVAGGQQVIGEAAKNTILNYSGMPNDSTGMEKYKETQDLFKKIIDGYDSRVLAQSAWLNIFSDPSNNQSFPAMIADGVFTTEGKNNEYETTLNNLNKMVGELEGIKRAFQGINEREDVRDNKLDIKFSFED